MHLRRAVQKKTIPPGLVRPPGPRAGPGWRSAALQTETASPVDGAEGASRQGHIAKRSRFRPLSDGEEEEEEEDDDEGEGTICLLG